MKRGMDKKTFAIEIKKAIYLVDGADIQGDIIDELMSKGYERGIASDIVEGNVLLDTFSTVELGVIANILHKKGGIPHIRIDKFLEEAEINTVNNYRVQKVKQTEDLLVFEDVRQVAHDIWTVVVPCQKIAELYRNHAVTYDFETQRDPKLIEVGDAIIKEANINTAAVAEIQDLLTKGLFIPNTITFNVPIYKSDSLKYDKKLNRLILTDKVLTILDGYHRSLGIVGALRENPNLDYNFEIRITNFNVDKARQFIVQEDKRNPINKEYIKSIDETDKITFIINTLNQDSSSELQGMITTENTLISSGNALVSFDIMHTTMNKLWNPNTIVESHRITTYLREFFNELVDMYPQELKTHIKESRKLSFINKESTFVLYLALASYLYGDLDWKERLHNTMPKISLNDETTKNFINTPPSTIRHGIGSYITIAENIIKGVFENERQII